MGESDYGSCTVGGTIIRTKRAKVTQIDLLNHLISEVGEIRKCMNTRLTSLETKVSVLVQNFHQMHTKLEAVEKILSNSEIQSLSPQKVLVHKSSYATAKTDTIDDSMTGSSIITLNSEEDYHSGSWLGDPNNSSQRVRCPILPQHLLHLNASAPTPEKMAVKLLDYLFTRFELATSNISGRSRWNKQQLDPLMIYGIRCHLQYKFNITSQRWHRICQNMDSKCRTLWKRRVKLMLSDHNKVTRTPHIQRPSAPKNPVRKDSVVEDISFDFDSLQNSNLDLGDVKVTMKVISRTPSCDLRVMNSTPDEISELQDDPEAILSDEDTLSVNDEKSILSNSSDVPADVMNDDLQESLTISTTHVSSLNNHPSSFHDHSSPTLHETTPLHKSHFSSLHNPSISMKNRSQNAKFNTFSIKSENDLSLNDDILE